MHNLNNKMESLNKINNQIVDDNITFNKQLYDEIGLSTKQWINMELISNKLDEN